MDLNHMRLLHREAADQLELMLTSLEAAEQATDSMRDTLDSISVNHWNSYLDILHMIFMHDDAISSAMKQYGIVGERIVECPGEDQISIRRVTISYLVQALLRRHRRMEHVYSTRGDPMSDYLKNSVTMESEHMAHLVSMIQSVI
jgi:hypothetical protein